MNASLVIAELGRLLLLLSALLFGVALLGVWDGWQLSRAADEAMRLAARQIEELLDRGPMRTLSVLARGQLDLYRVTAAAGGRAVGARLRTVKLTPHWSVIAVQHGDETIVPGAEDQIEPGDTGKAKKGWKREERLKEGSTERACRWASW